MPTNEPQRSHWKNPSIGSFHWDFSDAFNQHQIQNSTTQCGPCCMCVWRLLLVSMDGLDFICKVYIPLSNCRLVPCGCCWDLIKLESIFFSFSAYKMCVFLWFWGFRIGPGGMRVCAWVLTYMMHSFSKHNPHGPRALYQLLNASLCARDRPLLSHSVVSYMKYTLYGFLFSSLAEVCSN